MQICIYVYLFILNICWGLYQKVGLYKNNVYEGIFPDKNVIQVFYNKK